MSNKFHPYHNYFSPMSHVKNASADHPILDVLAERYSPYVFEPTGVEREKLLSCLEAARWAASSYNEQPWSFIIAERSDEDQFSAMLNCLVEANQHWAANAGVLMVTVAQESFSKNNKPNRVCDHDIGLAVGNLTVQATSLGLAVHQMAGINLSKTRQVYSIPDSHHPLTAIALGYAGDAQSANDEQMVERDAAPRNRKPLSEFVFQGSWNNSFS